MKVLLIKGSPHRNGSSNILADSFMAGAKESGHEVIVFDVAHAEIAPCIACEYCHTKGKGECCQKDDMTELKNLILSSDMVVLATPLYFFNMSAQLKLAIDRCYSFLDRMSHQIKKLGLIVTANNPNPHIMDIIVSNYLSIANFLGAENAGIVLATGCGTPEITRQTDFPGLAYEFGKSI